MRLCRGARVWAACCAMLVTMISVEGHGQSNTPPLPIPTPPIPGPAKLSPAPRVVLGKNQPPVRPSSNFPDAPVIDRLPIPPIGPLTEADPSDPAKLEPRIAAPPAVSPGADADHIQKLSFAFDPGATSFSQDALEKLNKIAETLHRNPASRLEIRIFSPMKASSESLARRLSYARFIVIRDSLRKLGLDERRIDARPLASDAHESGADRAEFYIEQ